MHSGFWEPYYDDPEGGFHFLEVVDSYRGISLFDFLHGYCDVFAYWLNKRYGYQVVTAYCGYQLIHAYCVDYIGSTPVYIDIRGRHTDWDEFWEEFYDESEEEYLEFYPEFVKDPLEFRANPGYEETVLRAAKRFVREYMDYYKERRAA